MWFCFNADKKYKFVKIQKKCNAHPCLNMPGMREVGAAAGAAGAAAAAGASKRKREEEAEAKVDAETALGICVTAPPWLASRASRPAQSARGSRAVSINLVPFHVS